MNSLSNSWFGVFDNHISIYIYIYEVRRKPRTRNLKESSFYYLGAFMFQEVGMKCHVKNMQSRKLPGRESRGFRKISRKKNSKYHVFCSRSCSEQRERETKRKVQRGGEEESEIERHCQISSHRKPTHTEPLPNHIWPCRLSR